MDAPLQDRAVAQAPAERAPAPHDEGGLHGEPSLSLELGVSVLARGHRPPSLSPSSDSRDNVRESLKEEPVRHGRS